jgi:hypothetical protein
VGQIVQQADAHGSYRSQDPEDHREALREGERRQLRALIRIASSGVVYAGLPSGPCAYADRVSHRPQAQRQT